MAEPKFTPGPWLVFDTHPDKACFYIDSHDTIAERALGGVAVIYTTADETNRANARLIAAAPEMFAALSVAAENLCLAGPDHDGMDSPSCGDSLCTGCIARAALKKAAP